MSRTPLSLIADHVRARTLLASSVVVTALTIVAGTAAQAGSFAYGVDRTSDFTISNSSNWQTILTLTIPSGFTAGHGHACQAVASLDAKNPGGDLAAQYVLLHDHAEQRQSVPQSNGVERTIEMRNQGGVNDPDFWPVSTNRVIGMTANAPQIIRLLGRKQAGAPNLIVDDAHLSIICVG